MLRVVEKWGRDPKRRAVADGNSPIIRTEVPSDVDAVRAVNLAAFPTSAEADLVDALRAEAEPVVSIVAQVGGEVIGHLMLSPASMPEAPALTVMALAPMAVAPAHQRRGIGSVLVTSALRRAKALGADVVIVLGHPGFYPRFGFEPASRWGVRCPYPAPDEAFMLVELRRGAIAIASPDVSGRTVEYHAAFGRLEGESPPAVEAPPAAIACVECGYTLRDPDADGRCPECGRPIAESIAFRAGWTEDRRSAITWTLQPLTTALVAQWLVLGAVALAAVDPLLLLGLAAIALLVHLVACWVAGECALWARTNTPGTDGRLGWRVLVRLLPIPALVVLIFAVATAEFVPVMAAILLVPLARAATLATAFDVVQTIEPEPASVIPRLARVARTLAIGDGVALAFVAVAAIVGGPAGGDLLVGVALIIAFLVSMASLVGGTVAAVVAWRAFRRRLRHG